MGDGDSVFLSTKNKHTLRMHSVQLRREEYCIDMVIQNIIRFSLCDMESLKVYTGNSHIYLNYKNANIGFSNYE